MRNSGVVVSAALALALSAQAAEAQQGRIEGRVHDASGEAAIVEAEVQVAGQGDPVLTDAEGRFSVAVAPGTHSVVVSRAGYGTVRRDGVQVAANGTVELTIELSTRAHILNPVVVTASRRREKALEAPASISIVPSDAVDRRAALTIADHVVALPGVDRAQTGLTSGTVVTRGFNNVFSGALLTIIDNRYARVPSLRFNAYSMFPTNDLDIDRVEVSLGPGAALYGPNAASGVMHLLTPSPLDRQGSSASVAGGERSLMHAQFRTAHALSDNLGLKVSGQYQSGTDWPADTTDAKKDLTPRDSATARYSVDARMDMRVGNDGTFVLSGGRTFIGSGVEMTGIGAYQIDDWTYNYLQARFSSGRFFGQFFRNMTNSGADKRGEGVEGTGTFNLRTGEPVVDRSYTWAAQFQYGLDLGSMQSFTYGVDWQRDVPRTLGTIYRDADPDSDVDVEEVGAYLHSETALGDVVDLVAAVRVDGHNWLEGLNVSPRAALVLAPSESQSFRATYNRAFGTPATNNLFLDINYLTLPGDFYSIRALGVPKEGFTFGIECHGGFNSLCMRTPLAPGQRLPADAPALWESVMDLLPLLEPTLANIVPLLRNPGALGDDPQLGTVLRRLDPESETFVLDPDGPTDVDRLRPTIHSTFEVGYKGLLGDRLLVAADVYRANVKDMVGPIRIETPNVFLEPQSVGAYVVHRLRSLIQAGLITEAAALGIAAEIAGLPLGTVVPDQRDDWDIIATYRNYADVDYWGIDLAAQYLVSDRLSLRAAYSTVSDDCFSQGEAVAEGDPCSAPLDIALNAPKRKGNLGFVYDDPAEGVTFEGRIRFTDSFPMNSGTYIGSVAAYQVVDASVSYDVPFQPGTRLTLTANNIGNNEHQEFVGAPQVGRLLIMRVRHEF